MYPLLIKSAAEGERLRALIRQERAEARRRAQDTVAESEVLLRQADEILDGVAWLLRAGAPLYVDPAATPISQPAIQHDYWLYAYDTHGNLIGPPIAIRACDDEAAIASAHAHIEWLDADLLDGKRLVKRIRQYASDGRGGGGRITHPVPCLALRQGSLETLGPSPKPIQAWRPDALGPHYMR